MPSQMASLDTALNTSHRSQSPMDRDSDYGTNYAPSRSTQTKPSSHTSSVDRSEGISSLDPRRFTPTLHANLVSEILSLRRDVDNKNKLILGLEDQLSDAEQENDQLNQQSQSLVLESRDLKRRLQILEGSSEDAIKNIAEERDTAFGVIDELKRRFDIVQRKLKSREDEVERVNSLWNSDKNNWEEQRRVMDRRIHVANSRLQGLTKELEIACDGQILGRASANIDEQTFHRSTCVDDRGENTSESADDRDEVDDGINPSHDARKLPHYGRSSGDSSILVEQSLAAELGEHFDCVSSDDGNLGEIQQIDRIAKSRSSSSKSDRGTAKARKVLGLDIMAVPNVIHTPKEMPILGQGEQTGPHALSALDAVRPSFTDAATQCSRGPSPIESLCADGLARENSTMPHDEYAEHKGLSCEIHDDDGNDQVMIASYPGKQTNMISLQDAASQAYRIDADAHTASTQTDPYTETGLCWNSAHAAIIRSDMPQRCITGPKYGNEVNSLLAVNASNLLASSSVYQTPSTHTDPHLSDKKEGGEVTGVITEVLPSMEMCRSDIRQRRLSSIAKPTKPYPVSRQDFFKDDESVRLDTYPRGSSRVSDAQVETLWNKNERDDFTADLTDDSIVSRNPVKKVLTKTKDGWKSITSPMSGSQPSLSTHGLHLEESVDNSNTSKGSTTLNPTTHKFSSGSGSERLLDTANDTVFLFGTDISTANQPAISTSDVVQARYTTRHRAGSERTRDLDIRKMALISSGASADRRTPPDTNGSTTLTNDSKYDPPFPVPDRSSSKKLPYDQDSPCIIEDRVMFYGLDHDFRDRRISRKVAKRIRSMSIARSSLSQGPSLIYTKSKSRHGSGLLDSQSTSSHDSPHGISPLLLENQNKLAPHVYDRRSLTGFEQSRSRQSSAVASRHTSASPEPTSVADAIAKTMIGEWMWKYVRRRKSFGLHESPVAEFERGKSSETGTARHRRWVWLAPYERAVMWSSKQPTSGPALMGKNGRKLVVQSVLDVRDDTPLPREAHGSSFFGRSILVLTAQRALKFTADDKERHIIWLTALSFLCHSSVLPQAPPTAPPVPSLHTSPSLTSDRLTDKTLLSGLLSQGQEAEASAMARNFAHSSSKHLATIVEPTNSGTSDALHDPSTESHDCMLTQKDIESDNDAAEAPLVPRFATRSRQKSNLSLGVPSRPSFRKFSNGRSLTSKSSMQFLPATDLNTNSIDLTSGWATDGNEAVAHSALNQRRQTAEITSRLSNIQNESDHENLTNNENWPSGLSRGVEYGLDQNYFEAIGTLRMQAFVDGFGDKRSKRPGRGGNRTNKLDRENVQ